MKWLLYRRLTLKKVRKIQEHFEITATCEPNRILGFFGMKASENRYYGRHDSWTDERGSPVGSTMTAILRGWMLHVEERRYEWSRRIIGPMRYDDPETYYEEYIH